MHKDKNIKNLIEKKCSQLADFIVLKKTKIIDVLLEYESYETACDEISRSVDCLYNIKTELDYLNKGHIKTICSFFPLNLPLYSLILFAIVPSFMANNVFIRKPESSEKILQKIYNLLKIDKNFSTITLLNINRNAFLNCYVSTADVIIFTGKYENTIKVKEACPNSFLIYNGAGINPVVITKSANLEFAINKTIEMRVFNSGQDCGGPDSVFVDSAIYHSFAEALCKKLSNIKIGSYSNRKIRIGKLCDYKQISLISKFFDQYHKNIIYGGIIDFEKYIVHPTVIANNFKQGIGYLEFFAPVFHIISYKNEGELKSYFENKEYQEYAMYISLFGNSKYLENVDHSIILKNKIINDVERGNLPYGGYGEKANFVSYRGKIFPRPILISKEISFYLENFFS